DHALLEGENRGASKHGSTRELKVVSDSLALKVDTEKASRPPLDGSVSLRRLKLRFDSYYVMDYDVSTWKQFPHYQKEVRINATVCLGSLREESEIGRSENDERSDH